MTLLKVNEPEWKLLHRIADGLRPEVQRELFTALDSLKKQIPTASIVDLIEDGRLSEVLAAVKLDLPDMAALQDAMGKIVAQSGARAISQVENLFPMRFDLVNPEAVSVIGSERWAKEYGRIEDRTHQLIQEVNRETQQAVSEIVQRGFLEGHAPRVQALAIRNAVGNHPKHAQATFRYLAELVDSGVSEKRAQELSAAYARRLLKHRAEMIARTETMRASNLGQQIAWENAADLGLFLPGEVQKVWIVTDDDRTCPRCLSLEDATIELEGSFTEGTEVAPRSGAVTSLTPPLHPMCRCAMGLVEVEPVEEVFEPTPPEQAPSITSPLTDDQWDMLDPSKRLRAWEGSEIRERISTSPDGKLLADWADKWTNAKTGQKRFRDDFEKVLAGDAIDKPALRRAEATLDALRTSPHDVPDSLHRGMAIKGEVDDVIQQFVLGDELDIPISSFTTDKPLASSFARNSAEVVASGSKKPNTRIVWELVGDAKQSLPIRNLSDYTENEWIAGGRFRIRKVTKGRNTTVRGVPSGMIRIEIEQVAGL